MASAGKSGAVERKAENSALSENQRECIALCDSAPQSRVFSELSRYILNDTLVESEYRAGYTTITVRSRFDGVCPVSDLVREIALCRLKSHKTD